MMDHVALLKTIVSAAGGILSLLLLAILLYRRVHRAMPVFVAYVGFDTLSGLVSAAVLHSLPRYYAAIWGGFCALDLILFLCTLLEVGRNLLASNRSPLGDWIKMPTFLFACGVLVLWPFVRWTHLPPGLSLLLLVDTRLMQARTLLTMAAILAFVVWSNIRKLRWPEREMHVITGMSVWELVSFAVLVAYTDGQYRGAHRWIDLMTPLSCIAAFFYWIHYFWLDPNATAPSGSHSVLVPAGADEVGTRHSSDARDLPAWR